MIRAVGEDPMTVDTSGFSPVTARYMGLLIGSATAGFGGAYLVLAYIGWFTPGITGGKGFIALAIVIAANWNPLVCVLVSYLFGTIDAIQLRFSVGGYEMIAPFLMAVPYIFTIVILVLRRKVFVPKALAKPYVREEE
jgi:simple sugar transport system permease protein